MLAGGGIMIVWPICSFRSFSMWLNFCNSSTLTLCIFAMEVSVSPFATTWLLPLWVDFGASDVDAVVEGAAGVSPMMTPGRMAETCCSSFKICCESASILAFCSSIFLVNASSAALSDLSPGGGWAGAVVQIVAASRKEKVQRAKRFIGAILALRREGGKLARAGAQLAFP